MSRGRWVLACLGCVAVVPLLAASAAAHPAKIPDQEWAYQTWYDGKIHEMYDEKHTSPLGWTAPNIHETYYYFRVIEVETFAYRGGQVTSESKVTVDAKGFSTRTAYDIVANKPVPYMYSCSIASKPTTIKNTTNFGSTAFPVPRSQNPLVQIAWSIPIPLAQNTSGVRWKVGGSKKCSVQGDYTAGAAGYFDPAKVPDDYDQGYNGNASIRYFSLKNPLAEWTKDFHVHLSGSGRKASNITYKAAFDLDTEVHFRALTDERLKDPTDRKWGAIVLDVVEAMSTGDWYPYVLVPGMGAGDVRLDVGATIVPKASPPRRRAAAAAKEVLIARGSKHLTRDAPFLLNVTLTPEGKALLAKHTGPLKGRLVLSFKPKGSKKWLTRSKSAVWPELTLP